MNATFTPTKFFLNNFLQKTMFKCASQMARNYSKVKPAFRNMVSIPYSSYLDLHKETFQELESIAQEKSLEFIDFSKKNCDNKNSYGTAPDGTPVLLG